MQSHITLFLQGLAHLIGNEVKELLSAGLNPIYPTDPTVSTVCSFRSWINTTQPYLGHIISKYYITFEFLWG